jgi:hypothetical protein
VKFYHGASCRKDAGDLNGNDVASSPIKDSHVVQGATMNRVPLTVWIAGAIILGLIVIALVGYGAGLWEVEP